jgi:hypothetical protein
MAELSALKDSTFDPSGYAEIEIEILDSVGYAVISRTAVESAAPPPLGER